MRIENQEVCECRTSDCCQDQDGRIAGWDRHHIPESEKPALDSERLLIVFSPETLEGEVTTRAVTYRHQRPQPKHTQLCFHKLIIQHIIIMSKVCNLLKKQIFRKSTGEREDTSSSVNVHN